MDRLPAAPGRADRRVDRQPFLHAPGRPHEGRLGPAAVLRIFEEGFPDRADPPGDRPFQNRPGQVSGLVGPCQDGGAVQVKSDRLPALRQDERRARPPSLAPRAGWAAGVRSRSPNWALVPPGVPRSAAFS